MTLLRGLGPWKESVFLVGGLTPRYLVAADHRVEGYRRDGPVAVARFELGEGDEADEREARMLRQREVSSAIEQLLDRIGQEAAWR